MRHQSHLLPARRVIGASVAVVHARHHDGALIGGLYAETHARRSQPVARKRVRLAAMPPLDPGARATQAGGFIFGPREPQLCTRQVQAEWTGIRTITGELMGKSKVFPHFPPVRSLRPTPVAVLLLACSKFIYLYIYTCSKSLRK